MTLQRALGSAWHAFGFSSGAALALGCNEPDPVGHAYLSVDTDVSVPRFVDRMLIEVDATSARTFHLTGARTELPPESIEYAEGGDALVAPGPLVYSRLLPLTIDLASDVSTEATVRIRAYRADRVVSGCEEEPALYTEEAPQGAPCRTTRVIQPDQPQFLVVSAERPAGSPTWTCDGVAVQSGVAAIQLPAGTAPGMYEVSATTEGDGPGPLLFVAKNCASPDVESVQCVRAGGGGDGTARLLWDYRGDADNDYTLILGNAGRSSSNVTLRISSVTDALPSDAGADAERGCAADDPRWAETRPDPSVAIDRLIKIRVQAGVSYRADVLLTGDCFGIRSDPDQALTCVDSETVVDVPVLPLDTPPSDDSGGGASLSRSGQWAGEQGRGCDSSTAQSTALRGDRVCVPGGAFSFGDAHFEPPGADGDPGGERVATISPFYLDRHEFTRGRLAQLEAAGISFGTSTCDGSVGSTVIGGDPTQPLTCVSWGTARALCRWFGGDLPSAAQWEYAAAIQQVGGDEPPIETIYPGDRAPRDCSVATEAQPSEASLGACSAPVRVDDLGLDSTASAVIGLGGNVAEWTLDNYRPLQDSCWAAHSMVNPECLNGSALRTIKGGSFKSAAYVHAAAAQRPLSEERAADDVGFRCAYPYDER